MIAVKLKREDVMTGYFPGLFKNVALQFLLSELKYRNYAPQLSRKL